MPSIQPPRMVALQRGGIPRSRSTHTYIPSDQLFCLEAFSVPIRVSPWGVQTPEREPSEEAL